MRMRIPGVVVECEVFHVTHGCLYRLSLSHPVGFEESASLGRHAAKHMCGLEDR